MSGNISAGTSSSSSSLIKRIFVVSLVFFALIYFQSEFFLSGEKDIIEIDEKQSNIQKIYESNTNDDGLSTAIDPEDSKSSPSVSNNVLSNRWDKEEEIAEANLLKDIKSPPEFCTSSKKYLARSEVHPRVVLLPSYPGSGNTWVRHLIQESTRVFTGSAYMDKKLMVTFPGEGRRDSTVLVVKTHFPCAACWQIGIPNSYLNREVTEKETGPVPATTTVVYLIRSPFDTLLAEFNRMLSGQNHTGYLAPEMMQDEKISERWTRFVSKRIEQWTYHVNYYLKNNVKGKVKLFPGVNAGLKNVIWTDIKNRPVHVMFYENLVKHPSLEIKRMIEWLTPIFEPGQLPKPELAGICAHFNQTGSYKRAHTVIYNPYSEQQKKMICDKVKRVWHEEIWGKCDGRLQRERKIHQD